MAAGNTYIPIATTTLASTAASVTFGTGSPLSGTIPQDYTDLVLVCNYIHSVDGATYIRFNSDSGSNYSRISMYGTGSAGASERASSQTYIRIAQSGTAEANSITQIPNYANATTYKTILNRWGVSSYVFLDSGLWRGSTGSATQAITTITVGHSAGGTFNIGSTFTLYGIKAA